MHTSKQGHALQKDEKRRRGRERRKAVEVMPEALDGIFRQEVPHPLLGGNARDINPTGNVEGSRISSAHSALSLEPLLYLHRRSSF